MERESDDHFGSDNKYVKELRPDMYESSTPWQLKTQSNGKKPCGMVLYYAPWCGICKMFFPIYEKTAKISGFCNFYAFNCEKYKAHTAKIMEDKPYLITGYPTVIIYNNGNPTEAYNGERTEKALLSKCMSNVCSK